MSSEEEDDDELLIIALIGLGLLRSEAEEVIQDISKEQVKEIIQKGEITKKDFQKRNKEEESFFQFRKSSCFFDKYILCINRCNSGCYSLSTRLFVDITTMEYSFISASFTYEYRTQRINSDLQK